MPVALARHLVSAADDLGNDLRLMLADPAEDEERRLGTDPVKEVEGAPRVVLHPALEPVPVVRRHHPADRSDVTVVFEDHGEDVLP